MANDGSRKKREIGNWGKIKGEIIQKYSHAYMQIMKSQKWLRGSVYVDAFAGAVENTIRDTGELVPGSAKQALSVEPPFSEYHFIDTDDIKAKELQDLSAGNANVHVYNDDGNRVLSEIVIPHLQYAQRRRGLVVLDPYGLDLDWSVVRALGDCRAADVVINFPTMDINRNALTRKRSTAQERSIQRMTKWWGDESWQEEFYRRSPQLNLFSDEPDHVKQGDNDAVVGAYCRRLRDVAGFAHVASPYAIRNKANATLYYVVFACPVQVGADIMMDILRPYRQGGNRGPVVPH